jgi:hypothetical protein
LTKLKVEGMNLTLEIKFRDHNAYCVFVREATMAGCLSPPPTLRCWSHTLFPLIKKVMFSRVFISKFYYIYFLTCYKYVITKVTTQSHFWDVVSISRTP